MARNKANMPVVHNKGGVCGQLMTYGIGCLPCMTVVSHPALPQCMLLTSVRKRGSRQTDSSFLHVGVLVFLLSSFSSPVSFVRRKLYISCLVVSPNLPFVLTCQSFCRTVWKQYLKHCSTF